MNDIIGENGLVPTSLLFGVGPWVPIFSTNIPTQKERLSFLAAASAEVNAVIAERKITTALTRKIPPAADRVYKLGEKALVYYGNEKIDCSYDCSICNKKNDSSPIA